MRPLVPVFGVAIAAFFVAFMLIRALDSSDAAEEAVGFGNVAPPADACGEGCGPPTPTPASSAPATSSFSSARAVATPCAYCDQDPDAWRSLTVVVPPELLGTAAVLMEGGCGEVLFGQNWREQHQPASLAKIATALVVAENTDLTDIVDVQITGWDLVVENESTIMGLIAGMRISVEELLYGLLLSSGNDAALELSRHLGGEDRVVAMMNERVTGLGLTDTVLKNSHGLDAPGAHTTPFDMAVLGRELLQNPLLRQVVATQFRLEEWHDLGGLWNGNYLLYIRDDAIGVKTGYTEEAGWLIVAAEERDGRLLIASVFDSADVYWDAMRLFDWAYENTDNVCG
jgi:D-alanyl-D-alanine carboxypeptidase